MGVKYAFVVGGTQSGCGKTSVALALMSAFSARGLRLQPFKVGPDFIDPGFHSQVTGCESRNLDGWMLGEEYNRALFRRLLHGADMAVIEGVMGLFDGYDGASEAGSSAQMAKWLGIPVILVVDARSMARSAAAVVHGFSRFDPGVTVAGVIFNRMGGSAHLEYLQEAMSANLPEIPVLGGIPREEKIHIPERHLGLVTADEIVLGPEWRETLARMVDRYVDLDLILQRTRHEGELSPQTDAGDTPADAPEPVTISVPRDAAFCFYYPDNFELLRRAGAKIHFFSPLAGETFPRETHGLYLGGGYPEVHAESLSTLCREGFLRDIRSAAEAGMPIYAECGGLMTLGRFIETADGSRYPMAGVLPFGTRMLARRKALGYTEVVLRKRCLLGEPGVRIRGHEFHYSELAEEEGGCSREDLAYEIRGRKHRQSCLEGYTAGSVLASYVHLHWGSAPAAPSNFVGRCREFKGKGKCE